MITAYQNIKRWVGLEEEKDDKKSEAKNGDQYLSIDESKFYIFDEDSSEWVEFTGSLSIAM